MLKSYFVVAIRNFWRNKIFSAIHILGLSIGLSASIVIFLIVRHEYSFDEFEPERERIYRVVMDLSFSGNAGHSPAVPAPLAQAIIEEVSGVQSTAPVMQFQGDALVNVAIPQLNRSNSVIHKKQADIIFTNPAYFDIMPFHWIVGSPLESLTAPFSVVLTESRARLYFPGVALGDIVGREITYDRTIQTYVTGIVDDLNETTDLTSLEFISHSTIAETGLQQNFMMTVWNDWMAYSKLYLKLTAQNDKLAVEKQLNIILNKYHKDANKEAGNSMAFLLQPLDDIHFNSKYAGFGQRTANRSTLYGLLSIAAFLLALACINFINLSTAQAATRAKEIGIRKTVGSQRKQLVVQFLCETLSLTAAATIISVSITPLLLGLFSDFIPNGVRFELLNDFSAVAFLVVITLSVSMLSGFYPALLLSGLRPVVVLKNVSFLRSGTRSSTLRKVLTVCQFIIAQFFVIGAFMVAKQINFSLTGELGYRKEAILNFELPRDTVSDHRGYVIQKINAIQGVQITSAGFLPPATEGGAFSDISYNNGKEEIKVPVQIRWGDSLYFSVYNIQLAAGRYVNNGNNINEMMINQSYASALGFQRPEDALNKELIMARGTKLPIVGVMRDFHESSFHRPIGPLAFRASSTGNIIHVALASQASGANWQEIIVAIQKVFNEVYPEEEFNVKFFDESLARFYVQEKNTLALLNWAMGLSIVISCLGLLGLVIYTSEARRKELGIRKILGASVSAIVSILSIEFIQLVLIAFVIAAPVAWWATSRWLEAYAFKTAISWWIFAASGSVLILVALLTISFQAVRTARSNPVNSIRTE